MNKSPRLGGINYQVSGDEMWKLLEIVDKYPGFEECIYQLAAAEKVHQASKIVEQINVKMGYYTDRYIRRVAIQFENGISATFRTDSRGRLKISTNYQLFDQIDDVYFDQNQWVENSEVRIIQRKISDKITKS